MRSWVQIPVVAPSFALSTLETGFCYTTYMATFSFDIVSEYDKAEMNNVFAQVQKEIIGRYDFKNTPAEIDWLDDKKGFKVTGANDWQIESIIDIIRKKLSARELSSKVLDLSKTIVTSNLKATQEIPFIAGLDQDKAKKITKLLREELPKVKTQIQGEAVRATASSKDDLQSAMQLIRRSDFDFPVAFNNFR
jgi:uncharacterized protein YajQ (UPF0234 family)